MKTSLIKKIITPLLAVAVLLLMVAWLAGSFDEKISPDLLDNKHLKVSIDENELYTVRYSKETVLEPVSASIEAKQATIISSRILARIEKINVRAGDTVQKGDVLIELEQSDLQSQASQVKEQINGLEARYQEAKKNLERASELYKKKLVSAFDLDKSKADFQSVSAEFTAARQAYKQAKTTLSYATITSPINGKVVDRFSEPGDTAQPGNKLLALYNPISLRIEANVREQLAIPLKQGQSIDVEIPSINRKLVAEVEEIVPAANTGSRSFLIKANIPFNEEFMPGMYARILIPSKEQRVIYLPIEKVEQVGQLEFVWVLNNSELQRRFIRIGKSNIENMVKVISGLHEGDIIANTQESPR
ncbi:hypothetical protein A9Q75_02595 [Colwellia psychrerythraea]|uniref:Uncharacterized protein n=1 Tax=Colwellia psychrerythraea TaxID=28229 RepID=A0A1Y5EV26_COLPS|nr:hypothetical protein A9Q75_02595 [Colwellia psychrerythraea]